MRSIKDRILKNRYYMKDKNKKHGLKGKKRPQEVRDKISAAHRNKPKAYSSWLKGRKGNLHPAYKVKKIFELKRKQN
jgi:hypothetical protein